MLVCFVYQEMENKIHTMYRHTAKPGQTYSKEWVIEMCNTVDMFCERNFDLGYEVNNKPKDV